MIQNKLLSVDEIKRKRGSGFTKIRFYECANPECNNEVRVDLRKFNFYSKSEKPNWIGCCRKCSHCEYVKEVLRGLINPWKTNEGQAKVKQTIHKKYGVENVFQSSEIKEKIKQTLISEHGESNPMRIKEFREKAKATCLKNFGSEYYFSSDIGKERVKQIQFQNYGGWFTTKQMPYITSKNGFINRFGEHVGIQKYTDMIKKRLSGLKNGNISKLEQLVISKLTAAGLTIDETQFKIVNNSKCYIYDIQIGNTLIEVNGNFWHANPKMYNENDTLPLPGRNKNITAIELWQRDLVKLQVANENNFNVFYIWESDMKNIDEIITNLKEILND